MPTLLVAVAGAAGAVIRYRIGLAVGTRTFPVTTLAINVSGSFLLAFLLASPIATRLSAASTTAIAVGLLGAYTTFSTFGYETYTLLRSGRTGMATAYVVLSLLLGLAGTVTGYTIGRAFA
jgi:CrcB protein